MTLRTEPVVVNVGPHHPSTHGVFRMKLTFDGENILDAEPVIGYLHRGTEKLAEERQYTQVITLTDRLDYVASMTNNQAYVLSCEQLVGIEPPDRGKYLRVIAAELQRIASHLIGVGFFLQELGVFGGTALMYAFRERESASSICSRCSAARASRSPICASAGCSRTRRMSSGPRCAGSSTLCQTYADELQALVFNSEIVLARSKGVAVVSPEAALDASFTGPHPPRIRRRLGTGGRPTPTTPTTASISMSPPARAATTSTASGCGCSRCDSPSASSSSGCEQIEPGPVRATMSMLFRPPPGESYVPIEAPKGELGFYLVSDGSIAPYRCHVRSPSFMSLTLFKEMLVRLEAGRRYRYSGQPRLQHGRG